MKLKVANNLFIVGTQVISYETVVASITDRLILVNGTYSRTTGKQIAKLRRMTGFEIVYRPADILIDLNLGSSVVWTKPSRQEEAVPS